MLVGGEAGEAIAQFALPDVDYHITVVKDAAAANVIYANGVCLRRSVLGRVYRYVLVFLALSALFHSNLHSFLLLSGRCDHEFPRSADQLRSIGGTVVQIEASELAKVDGALTCCSLLLDVKLPKSSAKPE